jgi:hypothetical protein
MNHPTDKKQKIGGGSPASNDNGPGGVRPTRNIASIDVRDFLDQEIPPPEYLLEPWIRKRGLSMIVAERGVGKTHCALGLAHAVATGSEFLGCSAPEPKKVLYLDGEMPLQDLQLRLQAICNGTGIEPLPEHFTIVPLELQEHGMPDLSTPEGQFDVSNLVDKADLVVVDNISTLCRTGEENAAEGWIPSQNWSLSLRARGKSVLWVHHAGRNGNPRGTSKREDVLDTVMLLERPKGVSADEGARFKVSFTKNRGFIGAEASSFEVKLEMDQDGANWSIIPSEDEELLEKVATCMNNGSATSSRAVSELLGISKNKANGLINRAKEEGRIN